MRSAGLAVWNKNPGDYVREGETVVEIYSMRRITGFDSLDAIATPVKALADGLLVTHRRRPVVSVGLDLFKLMNNVSEWTEGEGE